MEKNGYSNDIHQVDRLVILEICFFAQVHVPSHLPSKRARELKPTCFGETIVEYQHITCSLLAQGNSCAQPNNCKLTLE